MIAGSVGDETTIVDVWLTTMFTGDTTLMAMLAGGVNADVAPPKAAHPLLVHQFQGGADVRGGGPFRIMLSGLWVVKIVGQTRDYLSLKPAADRVDALLNAAAGTTTDGGLIFSCTREQPFRLAESENGNDYRSLGGLYRILAQNPTT